MKKIITSIFIAFMMITTIIPVNALEENMSIEYLSNGDYIETTIVSNISKKQQERYKNRKIQKCIWRSYVVYFGNWNFFL